MTRKLILISAGILSLLCSPLVSKATVIGACDADLSGSCITSVDINSAGTQFTIVLSNTSALANGGFITANAFDLPGTLGAILVSPTNSGFTLISGEIKVVPIEPSREYLLTTDPSPDPNNSFEGGGSPNSGIAPGSTLTFIFDITGGTLTDSFINELFILNSQVIRFRGFNDGGSDKDIVLLATVPEAASVLLFATGLVVLVIGKKGGRR